MSDLPSKWVTLLLEDVCDIVRGITFPASAKQYEKTKQNVCCLRTTNIQREIQWKDVYFVPREYVKRDTQFVQTGDILMSMANSYELVGKVAVARMIPYDTAFGAFLSAVRPKNVIFSQYLFHFLRSDNVQREIREGSSQTTNIANISVGTLSAILVHLAPLNEQKRIADKLDAILARVDACRARLDHIPTILKRFRQAVLAAATSGKLTEEWRDKTGIALDDNWKSISLGNLVKESANGLSKRRGDSGDETIVLRLADFKNSERVVGNERTIMLTEKELSKYSLLEGDLLVVRVNGSRDLAGKFVAYKKANNEIEAYCDHFIRLRLNVEQIIPAFALFVANSGIGRTYVESVLVTSAGQNTINQAALFGLSINLPSLSEQVEIIRRVETLFAYADRLEARYAAARAQVEKLTPALLTKAFRGELVPQDPNDEPASVLLERIKLVRTENEAKPKRGRNKAIHASAGN